MADPTDRVKQLREQTLHGPMMSGGAHFRGPRRELLLCQGWAASANQPTTRLRRAACHAYRLEHERVVINDHELIVGMPDLAPLTEEEQERYTEMLVAARSFIPRSGGVYDHMALDYPTLIEVGVNGLIADATQRRDALDLRLPENTAKGEFYRGCLLELNALLGLAQRYAARARELAADHPPERARELLEIADILDRVPAGPATTFREALQSVHFYTFMLQGDYQMGRPDQYLIGRYRADIAAGRLTRKQAQELIDCFCLLYSAYHPRSSSVGFMVGGRDPEGNAVNNELTYLLLGSIAHTRLAYPSIGLCVHDETPDDLLDLAVKQLANGYSHPAIFNDDAVTQGLLNLGIPARDARIYVHSSCVEITLCGQSGCWVFNPRVNLPALLLDVMKATRDCSSMGELLDVFEQELCAGVAVKMETEKMLQLERSRNNRDSMLSSCLVNDCLKTGKGIDEGGANWNFIMPTFLGIANLVDSLAAIGTLVFDNRELTMAEFRGILTNNFADSEPLRQRIVNKLPHFGNDEPVTDGLMRQVSEMLVRSCDGLVDLFGCRAVPGVYSYLQHVKQGENTSATPDGRKAGTALGAASSPVQGRDVSGPTAAILSSTCWNQLPFMGGVAINVSFQPGGRETRQSMKAMIKTLSARGGLQLQVTCVSRETLLEARRNPDAHRGLLVRIGGYSDYFTALPPAMQDEIVARTQHTAVNRQQQ